MELMHYLSKESGIEMAMDILPEEIIMTSLLSSLSFSLLSLIQSFMSPMHTLSTRSCSGQMVQHRHSEFFYHSIVSFLQGRTTHSRSIWTRTESSVPMCRAPSETSRRCSGRQWRTLSIGGRPRRRWASRSSCRRVCATSTFASRRRQSRRTCSSYTGCTERR